MPVIGSAVAAVGVAFAQSDDDQMTIASAVEEQTATTNEMIRSTFQRPHRSASIADNIPTSV